MTARPISATAAAALAAALAVALAAAALAAGASASAAPAVTVSSRYAITATVGVGVDPLHAAVDPVTHRVFVANDGGYHGTGSVSVIDGLTNTIARTITVPGSPNWVAVDPRIGRAWVSNQGGAQVDAIDTTTEHYLGYASTSDGEFDSGLGAAGVAVDPAKQHVYAADSNPSAGQTSVLSEGSMSLVHKNVAVTDDPGPTGAQPHGVALDAGRGLLFTANIGNDSVSVLNAESGVPTHIIDLQPYGADPEAVYYEASTNRLFVAMWSTNANKPTGQVLVLDGSTFTKVAAIPVDVDPSDIAADPADHAIFVANQAHETNTLGAPGSLIVIDDRTLKVEQTVLTPPSSQSTGVTVDPETHTVYVVNDASTTGAPGTVSVVNLVIASGPGTIGFGSTAATATAGATATVSVVRTGNTNLVSSVRYATSDGTARAGRDYTRASGTLHFAKGVRVLTFGVRTIGTSTKAASLSAHLTLSDAVGGALKVPYRATLTIAERAAPTLSAVPGDATVLAGHTYSATVTAAARPAATYAITGGALPAGLTLNRTTGKLTGTPRAGGTFTYRIAATNGIRPSVLSGPITLTVYKAPTFTADTPDATVPVNSTSWLGYVFKVDEYPIASQFTISSGAIPTGLKFNNGFLFGTPTVPGTYTFTVTATNQYAPPAATTPTITMTITP